VVREKYFKIIHDGEVRFKVMHRGEMIRGEGV
jgi:hypothetical protein